MPLRALARLLLLAWLVLPTEVRAQRASVEIDADSLRVGAPFALVVTVQAQGTVLPLDSAFAGTGVSLVGAPETTTALDGAGMLTTRLAYDARAFALDTLLVPPFTVRVVNSVDTMLLTTAPIAVRMERLVPDDSTATLRPARPSEPFGPPAWLLVLLALALAAAVMWWLRRRRAAAPAPVATPERVLTPLEALMQQLTALDRIPPDADADARPYFDTLTDAFRTYLEARLSVPAREQTSRELIERIERLERAGTLQAGAAALARDLFRVSDLARFADVRPGPQAARIAVEQTRTLAQYVEQSRSRRQGVPRLGVPPGGTASGGAMPKSTPPVRLT